ncbi:MAG: c-type cytochrome domain-containing protein [Planctomycetaceae bacterium]
MRWKSLFVFGLILSNAAFAASHANAQAVEDNRQKEEFFETHVRPLLLDRCIECHGPKKQEGELRLDQRQQVLQAIVSDVKLIDLESVTQSRLLQVIQHAEDDVQMPPSSKLPDESIAVLTRWISEGAFWPETANLEADAIQRAEQWRQHWAFQPPVMPDLSQVPDAMNPVDYFVTSKLSEKQLHPSPGADIRTLVRRLSYALTGLPPALGDYDAAEKAAGDKKAWINQYTDQLRRRPTMVSDGLATGWISHVILTRVVMSLQQIENTRKRGSFANG